MRCHADLAEIGSVLGGIIGFVCAHRSRFAGLLDASELFKLARGLADSIQRALIRYTNIKTEKYGLVTPYEINGFGSYNLMDDANAPGLLSLPYLVPDIQKLLPDYRNTRNFILSESNPFFFKGKTGEGIGGPHVGMDYIWPMSIIMRGLTSNDDKEIKNCLATLQHTHAGTGFMHEAFHKDDAAKFTRKWFAWANTLFGEFVWKVYQDRPHLIN